MVSPVFYFEATTGAGASGAAREARRAPRNALTGARVENQLTIRPRWLIARDPRGRERVDRSDQSHELVGRNSNTAPSGMKTTLLTTDPSPLHKLWRLP
ncbi:hypothetical protein EVAR_92856_1 [Eumeta japonica]|uniref:Uncharacterized protein n=1 Tax=Eumeta variegata TaxID=151549 RepID=A0A4C1TB22_EUMVA|nr:hypothetical protein EVAR_92856_1 [Eumeta japonica]